MIFILNEFWRFVLCSISTVVVCWGTLILMVETCHIHYLVSANLSACITYVYAFFLNKYVVFKRNERKHFKQGIRYLILQVFLLFVGNCILYMGVDFMHFNYLSVTVIMSIFMACLNFTLMKIAVFN
jgi:putative flippase GtrA